MLEDKEIVIDKNDKKAVKLLLEALRSILAIVIMEDEKDSDDIKEQVLYEACKMVRDNDIEALFGYYGVEHEDLVFVETLTHNMLSEAFSWLIIENGVAVHKDYVQLIRDVATGKLSMDDFVDLVDNKMLLDGGILLDNRLEILLDEGPNTDYTEDLDLVLKIKVPYKNMSDDLRKVLWATMTESIEDEIIEEVSNELLN